MNRGKADGRTCVGLPLGVACSAPPLASLARFSQLAIAFGIDAGVVAD